MNVDESSISESMCVSNVIFIVVFLGTHVTLGQRNWTECGEWGF